MTPILAPSICVLVEFVLILQSLVMNPMDVSHNFATPPQEIVMLSQFSAMMEMLAPTTLASTMPVLQSAISPTTNVLNQIHAIQEPANLTVPAKPTPSCVPTITCVPQMPVLPVETTTNVSSLQFLALQSMPAIPPLVILLADPA